MAPKTLIILLALIAIAHAVATPCNSTHIYKLPSTGMCYIRTIQSMQNVRGFLPRCTTLTL